MAAEPRPAGAANRAAVQLIEICAHLAPEPIPSTCSPGTPNELPEPLAVRSRGRVIFGETVGASERLFTAPDVVRRRRSPFIGFSRRPSDGCPARADDDSTDTIATRLPRPLTRRVLRILQAGPAVSFCCLTSWLVTSDRRGWL